MELESRSIKDFLESVPPGKFVGIFDLTKQIKPTSNKVIFDKPDIILHCDDDLCKGYRGFSCRNERELLYEEVENDVFVSYICRNCDRSVKTFAIRFYYASADKIWLAWKYGEQPSFGPPIPSRTVSLIGGEKDLFFMGRRCENQGMGIGAFVYYRRVLESQKNRIFDELIRVINKISPGHQVLSELELAKSETQFTKAIDSIKHALPDSLFTNGSNPLTLLHSALSKGLHADDESECLELAGAIRTVLIEFAERLGNALREDAELENAINKLAQKHSAKITR